MSAATLVLLKFVQQDIYRLQTIGAIAIGQLTFGQQDKNRLKTIGSIAIGLITTS